MGDDAETPLSEPPPPLPKRMNAVWRLFDAPLYRDWLFWFTVGWVAVEVISVLSYGPPSSTPPWFNALIGALFFVLIAGILPAWGRLLFRRWRHERRQRPEQSGQTLNGGRDRHGSQAKKSSSDYPLTGPRESQAAVVPSGDTAATQAPPPGSPDETSKGLGVTAADPALVDIDTSGSTTPAAEQPAGRAAQVQWDWERINPDGFERLLARLLEQSGSYVRITRLMNTNAADAGRDIQAYRRVNDGLVSDRYERTIVQAKHWPKRGIGPSEIADLVHAKLPLWEGEPVRGLIVATSGSFTQDAVRWVDNHNRAAKRPDIVLWSSSELEMLLRKWPQAATGLERR
ncbi:restriction endonuclease [Amycolatopsis sp. YIM 10]|uniref:restriction endonuclease n=1 Tax=Amycolatopsis sp. YIM 10 TaxID=2653857 RepID=UPI00128FFE71|nr:restriction endonuclease [Amycolatopsis sp. YIM 10]QFU86615.1 hypothetical protein YIM_07020 [Amycolatopsis sp. YIM 10]